MTVVGALMATVFRKLAVGTGSIWFLANIDK